MLICSPYELHPSQADQALFNSPRRAPSISAPCDITLPLHHQRSSQHLVNGQERFLNKLNRRKPGLGTLQCNQMASRRRGRRTFSVITCHYHLRPILFSIKSSDRSKRRHGNPTFIR